jgi:CsoR family transcriptional regulator, copper-sensing transcriptional repressor
MLRMNEKKEILKRFHYVTGQIHGIEKMIQNDRPLKEVYTQLQAVEKGIGKAIYVVFQEQLKKNLAEVLSKRLAECPGNCSDAERLEVTRQQFAKLDLK